MSVALAASTGVALNTSGKLVAIAVTRGARKRLARPMTALASWIRVGVPSHDAASTGGTVGYPPKPTTAAGLSRPSSHLALNETVAEFGRR